jgi:hypothetical protein
MGTEIGKSHFSEMEFETFRKLLRKETAVLKGMFDREEFVDHGKVIGLELETWLVNNDFIPAPDNDRFLAKLDSPYVVPELSRFNAEINAPPSPLAPGVFSTIQGQLMKTWDDVQRTAGQMNRKMLMIGSLPTLRDEMLTEEYMSDLERYRAFNLEILKVRKGHPVVMDIEGKDHLRSDHNDIMLEAAATSLQIHFQVEPDRTHHYYNASIIASAPMAAITANTPYLFGKDLWAETRIPIFEQSLDLPGYKTLHGSTVKRVTLGGGYARRSLMELFIENLDGFPILLPILYDTSIDSFAHVKLHNGSIWRWNRPIIGMGKKGITLRVEHRVPSSGPTITDIVANMAFYIGLTHELARHGQPFDQTFPFPVMEKNFYSAAQEGFDAKISWNGQTSAPMPTTLLEQILPMARAGLVDLGIDEKDIRHYIDEVIRQRILTGQTGSQWQRSWIATHGFDFQGLTAAYFKNQESNLPVHEWSV